jgi:hypothetical protein
VPDQASKKGSLAMFLVTKNFHCFIHQWPFEAHTSLRSATYSGSPLEFTEIFNTKGLGCQRSLQWYFFSLCWRFCELSSMFLFYLCSLEGWSESSKSQTKVFPYFNSKPLKKAVFSPWCYHWNLLWTFNNILVQFYEVWMET